MQPKDQIAVSLPNDGDIHVINLPFCMCDSDSKEVVMRIEALMEQVAWDAKKRGRAEIRHQIKQALGL